MTHSDDSASYLNVDPSTDAGLTQMNALGVFASGAAEMIVTPRGATAALYTTAQNAGRMFIFLRHPVKRIVEQFYYLQSATFDPDFNTDRAAMTIEDYARSNDLVDNIVVRQMLGLTGDEMITDAHVQSVKDILRQKFVVGIYEWMTESMMRFEYFFGWNAPEALLADRDYCRQLLTYTEEHFPIVITGGPVYKELLVRNWADTEIFAYSKLLFAEQSRLLYVPDTTPTTAVV